MGAIVGQSTNAWFKKTKMGIWFYKKVDKCYSWAAKRYDLDVLSKDARTRYLELRNLIPQIDNLIPQYQIASFLNITPVQLSRIRSEI